MGTVCENCPAKAEISGLSKGPAECRVALLPRPRRREAVPIWEAMQSPSGSRWPSTRKRVYRLMKRTASWESYMPYPNTSSPRLPIAAGHHGPAVMDAAIDLGAHAELPQVDPRLDGEARALAQETLVGELDRVEIHSKAVNPAADGMPRPVTDIVGEPRSMSTARAARSTAAPLTGIAAGEALVKKRERRFPCRDDRIE